MSVSHRLRTFFLCALLMIGTVPALAQEMTSQAQSPAQVCAAAVPAADPSTRTFEQAEPVLVPGADYYAVFCTAVGPVTVDLLEDYTPLTVNNFVFLAEQGYYNNTTFHRVIQGFMAQGGDPTATGTGGPGYQFLDEPVAYLTFDTPGLLAMANAGQSTNGSQFFITTAPTPHLNYRHTLFGKVVEGQEHVNAIRLRDPETDPEPGTALETVVIVGNPMLLTLAAAPDVVPSATTADAFQAAFYAVQAELPAELIIDESSSRIYTTAETAAQAPEALRDDYAAFLSEFGHQYRVFNSIESATCDLTQFPFMAVSYTVDAFETSAQASAALQSGFVFTLPPALGYVQQTPQPLTLANPMFLKSTTACDLPANQALTVLQRGRLLITAQILLPVGAEGTPDQWLSQVVVARIYDQFLAELLAAEL
jgi:peptidyl-prolyl cis-trans isomerase B (cyclophilin B)